jgi:hypothetical protein
MQVVAEDAVAIDSFESRLRSAVVEARSQVVGPAQFCGWARVETKPHQRGVES